MENINQVKAEDINCLIEQQIIIEILNKEIKPSKGPSIDLNLILFVVQMVQCFAY